jgi:hypothetical protein
MMALHAYGGHGPPAASDYTPLTFNEGGGEDPSTHKINHKRNHTVTDRTFPQVYGSLRTLRNLDLDLSYTDLTDASMPLIAKLDLLKLDVAGTRITPESLLQLRGKPKLYGLALSSEGTTSEQVKALADALHLPRSHPDPMDDTIYLSSDSDEVTPADVPRQPERAE